MLSVYVPRGSTLERIPIEPGAPAPEAAVWIDLVTPTVQEDRLVEAFLGIAVPTREEMQEIEVSSRLYIENGARYMTATLMCQSDTATPKTTPVTFILSSHRLCTVRYDEPRPFAIVEHKLARACSPKVTGEMVLMDLLDAVIDRAADIQERIGAEVDQVSHSIFEPDDEVAPPSYNDVLKALGRKGDLTSKVRESQVSVGRLLSFLANEAEGMKCDLAVRSRDLLGQQDHLPARRHARRRQHPAERHHQDFLDRGGGVHAADADRLDLRYEPPPQHDRARVGVRLPVRADIDHLGGGAAAGVLQVEEVAVGFLNCHRRRSVRELADKTVRSINLGQCFPNRADVDRDRAIDGRVIAVVAAKRLHIAVEPETNNLARLVDDRRTGVAAYGVVGRDEIERLARVERGARGDPVVRQLEWFGAGGALKQSADIRRRLDRPPILLVARDCAVGQS